MIVKMKSQLEGVNKNLTLPEIASMSRTDPWSQVLKTDVKTHFLIMLTQ